MELEDRIEPAFTFTAIDSLTDLKDIRFNYDGPNPTGPYIRNVLAYIFRQLPTDFLLDDIPIRFAFASELVPNTSFFTDNLIENLINANYYSTIENNVTVPLHCWDVLVEILSRLHLHCRYQLGSFFLIGLETIHLGSSTPIHYYDKNGGLIASDPFWTTSFTDFNFNNKALVGGKYNFESGYKYIRIEGDVKFSNKKSGSERIVVLGIPTPADSLFNYVGTLTATKSYKLRVKIRVTELTPIANTFFTFQLSVKTLINGVETILLTDKEYRLPLTPSEFIITEDIASSVSDRDLLARYKLVASPGIPFKANIEGVTAEVLLENDKVVIESSLDNTNLIKRLTRKVLATDTFGTEFNRFYFWDRDPFVTRQETRQWKFSGGSTWRNLERVMTEHQIKYMSKIEMLTLTLNNIDNWNVYFFSTVLYDSKPYYIAARQDNLYTDNIEFNLIAKNTAKTNTITTVESAPVRDATDGNVSSITGNVILSQRKPVRIYDRNVNANSFNTGYSFDPDYTWESVQKSVIVYINGIKQYLKETSTLSSLHQNEIYLNLTTGVLSFPITYTKAKVEVYITDFFEIAIVA